MKISKLAFSLAEMMVVMLILTIILAASTPLITKRASRPHDVVYKVVTIQVPTQQGESKVVDNVQLSGPDAKKTLDKIISDQKNLVNQQYQQNSQVQQTQQGQNNHVKTNNSQAYEPANKSSNASKNIYNQEVVNMQTVQDKYGESHTVVTLSSGERVIISSDENGMPMIKTLGGIK